MFAVPRCFAERGKIKILAMTFTQDRHKCFVSFYYALSFTLFCISFRVSRTLYCQLKAVLKFIPQISAVFLSEYFSIIQWIYCFHTDRSFLELKSIVSFVIVNVFLQSLQISFNYLKSVKLCSDFSFDLIDFIKDFFIIAKNAKKLFYYFNLCLRSCHFTAFIAIFNIDVF